MRAAACLILGIALTLPCSGKAQDSELAGSVAAESRIFPNAPSFASQKDRPISPSAVLQPEVRVRWNDGADHVTFAPFLRLDLDDAERTHADIRELNWLHRGDDWVLRVGIGKVFCGVSESRHLVDIVNQTDLVEDIDQESKLGEPMVHLDLTRSWGNLGLFVLPGFRERVFSATDARLSGGVKIGDADFESGAGRAHLDVVARYSATIGGLDFGLAHFHGTSRESRLLPRGGPGLLKLTPFYDQIDQSSLDLQYTTGPWLLKLEAIRRSGHGDPFFAMVGGFEYTLNGILDTPADLGFLAEYLYDGRGDGSPPTPFDDDLFLGVRLVLNDVADTTLLVGGVIDRNSNASLLSLELGHRLGEHWRLELEGKAFIGAPRDDPLHGIRQDDHLQVRLARFF